MDSDEEYDITKNLAFADSDSDESENENSSNDEELQDEIISSDSESESEPVKQKGFPKLEFGDDETVDDFDSMPQYMGNLGSKKMNSGTFAGMGLSKNILRNITKKGFKNPTPIQRKAIPPILSGRDVVGMARTGSGKTAAFVLPMLEKLKIHSAKVGSRALILSPSRELAMQTMKVVKEFSKGSDLRSVLLVGGDSMEQQFEWLMSNPDIVIATPGRFMHLKVEMNLNLKSIEYIVFDEADRLFELGFSEQLNEILASLNSERQTLLFSATLPKSLVDFAKAGLTDPTLIRLDTETKISDDLELAFFAVKDAERDAGLLYVLERVIKMPLANEEQRKSLEERETVSESEDEKKADDTETSSKRKKKHFKKKMVSATELPTAESTIVFVPTKHHVEYVANLLRIVGYAVSYIYGTLDQTARKEQLYRFRAGLTSVMVVTDIAARGIDIPVLANVVNYTLPSSPKVFVHRVGRTARAGRRGWAYSLVLTPELPYLLDLEVFLGRKLFLPTQTEAADDEPSFNDRLVVGGFPRDLLELHTDHMETILKREYDLLNLKSVAERGEKLYLKSRNPASHESVKRAKQIQISGWDNPHILFGKSRESMKQQLLDKFAKRKSKETVFEYKKMAGGSDLMAKRRKQIASIQHHYNEKNSIENISASIGNVVDDDLTENTSSSKQNMASEKDIEDTFGKNRFRDDRFFLSHYEPTEAAQEKAYSTSESGFAGAARAVTFDLNGEGQDFVKKQGMVWDKKKGKYVNSSGGDNKKYIKGENGVKIPASYRSGKFDQWKAAHKTSGIKVGSMETTSTRGPGDSSKRFKHNRVKAPKAADKARDDYKVRKLKVENALQKGLKVKGVQNRNQQPQKLNNMNHIQKQRRMKERRREKNARPTKKRR